jgi:hypothetical protein
MTAREAQLQTRVKELEAELSRAQRENALLRQKIDLLSRKIFGCSSEKLSPDQLQLLLELAGAEEPKAEEPEEPGPLKPATRLRKERKPRLPDHLPVVEEIIDPEPVKAQPDQWRCIGQEVTEQLDYEPAKFIRRRLVRRKYAHRTEKDFAPVIAPLPPCLQERCLATPRAAGAGGDQQILRSPPALPAGGHFQTPPRSGTAPADALQLDGVGRRLVATHLRASAAGSVR